MEYSKRYIDKYEVVIGTIDESVYMEWAFPSCSNISVDSKQGGYILSQRELEEGVR